MVLVWIVEGVAFGARCRARRVIRYNPETAEGGVVIFGAVLLTETGRGIS